MPSVSSPTDVVFFVYLYQRWIYRVDPNRVNEFGTSGVDLSKKNTAEGDAAAPPIDAATTPSIEATPPAAIAAAATAAITDKPEGEKKND